MRLQSIVPAAEILEGRNRASWSALAFAAGFVNATTFLSSGRFTSHVTGILTHAGTHIPDVVGGGRIDEGGWVMFAEYLIVFVCFVVGAMMAVLVLDVRRARGLPGLPWLPLSCVAALLAGAAIAGHLGLFGTFGSNVEPGPSFVLLWTVALAMGLQNASVANATGSIVRTTHMTGPATDLGVSLAFLVVRDLPVDVTLLARRTAVLRLTKIAGFVAGGFGAAVAVGPLGFLAFLVPAAICAAVAANVFARPPTPTTP